MDQLTFIFGPDIEGLSAEDAAKRSTRSYVRGEGGIAVYEESRNPTGHVLTAWEAPPPSDLKYSKRRWSTVPLSGETVNATGDALRVRREELGLSPKSVMRAARVSPGDVQLSAHKVSIQKLERIAFALGWTNDSLVSKKTLGETQDWRTV